ncbi:hypothetical protein WR25_14897 [Diploscapter pachys]|uniref:Uncharacterized protein n=1 Tax=Diploscapter pachys TaxID=2018661 RepID=A0A2A2J4J1_9BILA|nr:hypothetical protein WR25_14897 [Diploscapter pachys]
MIQYAQNAADKVRSVVVKSAQLVGSGIVSLWRWLTSPLPSKALPPSAPRPYLSSQNSPPSSPSYNKVVFEPPEIEVENESDQPEQENEEDSSEERASEEEKQREAERENERKMEEHRKVMEEKRREAERKETERKETERRKKLAEEEARKARERAAAAAAADEDESITLVAEPKREKSVPPPAPPPPPAKPTRITPARETLSDVEHKSSARDKSAERTQPKIGALPKDVMQELTDLHKKRERGLSAQREMTQSCHPDMNSWASNSKQDDPSSFINRTGSHRANSVGPSMRKLEQHVSRLEGNSDDEAQYVFRPKKAGDDDFYMGRYVISPLEEAEQMRAKVNSQRPQSVAPSGGFHQSVQPPVSSCISNQQNSHASRRNETLVHFKFLSLAVRLMMIG